METDREDIKQKDLEQENAQALDDVAEVDFLGLDAALQDEVELDNCNAEYLEKSAVKKKSFLREVFEWVAVLAAGVVIALIISNFVILNAHIPSGSMETTILKGDRVIGFRMSYLFSEPQRGDIVIFKYPDNEERVYIKRVIGVPGDLIQIDNGDIYVNGSKTALEEPYAIGETYPGRSGVKEYKIPEDCYFMLGDNREDSEDSRFWINTYVHKDKILAKAILRYYPNVDVLDDYHE